ncbi:MAG TPA: hypothetical protein PKH77_10140 [Anaerolineae bacterium]|nr:hypothetical protein [Anaerolineae bacterium]
MNSRAVVALCAMFLVLSACRAPDVEPLEVATASPAPRPSTRPAPAAPARPPSGALVTPDDFTYLGAFRLPDDGDRPRTFAYGGNAMTFNPDNGTLFIMGHDRMAYGDLPDGNQVAEISLPTPVNSRNVADLPAAEFRQGFHNVLAGRFTDLEEIPRAGMAYLDHPATGPKIHLGWGQHLPPDTPVPTHGWFAPDLAQADFQGVWFIGNQDFNSVNGYLFEIPAAWADAHVQGRVLAAGRYRDGGWSGMGPALFAYRPWEDDGSPPPSGTRLEETVLLHYATSEETDAIERALTGYQHPDEWEGGAWLTTRSGKSAVIFAGTKATGAKYWYGWANPTGPDLPCVEVELVDQFTLCRLADGTPCPPEDLRGCEGHNDYRGWWSTRFDAQIVFYDPDDLARVAAGTLEPWGPQPYATLALDDYLYLNPPAWELDNVGRGDQRRMRIGDVAYDRERGRLYVLELFADEAKPVVHVWQVGAETPVPPRTSLSTPTATLEAPTQEPTSTSWPTLAPTATPIILQGPEVTYGGVSLRIPPAWENIVYAEAISRTLENREYHPDSAFLQYVQFSADPSGYETFGSIIVYPVQSVDRWFEADNWETIAGELRAAIPTQAPDYFPVDRPACIVLQVQTEYLHFQNVSGVRAVIAWGQDLYPLSNERLFYAFRGLDDENRYYIAVTLPVDAASLPPLPEKCESNGECCETYNQEVQALLAAARESDFEPNLAALDEVVTSLRITHLSATNE